MVATMLRGYAGKIWLITFVGLAGRLALLGYQPLWRDEAFTALAVQRSLGSMLDVVRNDSAPPLFYLVERVFAVMSTSPVVLRLFPVLLGTAAIPLLAALGRRVAGDRGGVWSAVIGTVLVNNFANITATMTCLRSWSLGQERPMANISPR